MRFWIGLLLGTVSFFLNATEDNHKVKEITWIERPESEQTIRINASTFDVIKKHLSMPVNVVEANTARALHMLNASEHVACRGDLRKTEPRLADFAVTSLPQVVYPSLRLFSHHKLDGSPIELTSLKQKPYVLPLQMHRDYGFDSAILDGGELVVMSMMTKIGPDNAIKMFDHKRADLLIEYPSVYQVYSDQPKSNQIYVYTIAGQQGAALGYIMCSNNEASRQVAHELDEIIRKVSATDEYLQAHQQWFSTIDIGPLYHATYDDEQRHN